jgi:Asp-tRNA(Asn)/Glu-tRNA(Gln) amidotransferase A subunit family amidase
MKKITAMLLLIATNLFAQEKADKINTEAFEQLIDIEFTAAERDSMQDGLRQNMEYIQELHKYTLTNSVSPALIFNPIPVGYKVPLAQVHRNFDLPDGVRMPEHDFQIAFLSVAELGQLIKSKQLTSTRLTAIYLDRLKRFSDTLECTVSLLEERAMIAAKKADMEIFRGQYRGVLHGIPYGLKDLFAVQGTVTSWGAMPYKNQQIDETATIVKKLEEAGAILVAKLTLGALAMGDVWYGGKTRNPWNPDQGSSGSSAGPGAATAAGLVGFAIGTETLGSIVSPSTRNGVTGLRPTFGRVSRAGGMALSWSMDKAGPMCRTALDCALVLEAIYGSDGLDQSVIDAAYNYDAEQDISSLKIGYLKDLFERDYSNRQRDSLSLKVFADMGAELHPVSLPADIPYRSLRIILAAEASAAFDALTRSGKDDQLVRQDQNAWPNYFRESRFIPAVEYIQANRVRYVLIQELNKLFDEYDAILTPSFGGPQLLATNLSGHPVVCIPNGFNESRSPTSFSIICGLFDEGTILYMASKFQDRTKFEDKRPPIFYR